MITHQDDKHNQELREHLLILKQNILVRMVIRNFLDKIPRERLARQKWLNTVIDVIQMLFDTEEEVFTFDLLDEIENE